MLTVAKITKPVFLSVFTGQLMTVILAGILILTPNLSVMGVPAYPHPIQFTQPDGTTITILLKGDERINWAETLDGYSILVTKEGYYEYAVHDEYGDMVFSGRRVSEIGMRGTEEKQWLESIPKGLFFSDRQTEIMRQVWNIRKEESSRFPSTGERTLIAILMQTPDVPFTKTQTDFDALLNQVGYTIGGATGSLKDYYLENSYGLFDLTVDVVGPYTAQHNMSHYGSTWAGARQLATEAVHLANPDVDYSEYDNNGNGWVEGIYMIFAGYGEEAGGGPNTIWSHAWNIDPVQLDGVWISRYACSPELRGNSGTNITRIGVIGHEFGHILGAPDFYDTDGSGSGGSFTGTGAWDMMAGGTWNNGGATPAHHNAYTKTHIYQWAPQIIINQPGSFTLNNAIEHYDSFYRINTNTPGEYYLLENRHHIGFDTHIPGEGMIIYHVHKEIPASGNSVNVGHPQKMYPVCAGSNIDPIGPPWTYGQINTPQTPFPGSTNQTSFSDISTPSSLSWAGDETNKPLTNITRNAADQTVSFDFMSDVEVITDWMHWDDGRHEGSVGLGSGGVYQIAHRFEPEDMLSFSGFQISGIRLFIGNMPTSAAVKIWQGPSQDSLLEVVHQDFTPPSPNGWVEVQLDEPYLINPNLELWFGAEYDDPGANVFTASRDIVTDHDGKGNLIRMNITDPEAWLPLTNWNITGDWNIQARLLLANLSIITYDVAGGEGEITAYSDDAEVDSGDVLPFGHDIVFHATPETGFGITQWTINGEVIPEYTVDTLEIHDLSGHVNVMVTFQEIYHIVDFFVEEGPGELNATVNNNQIQPGEDIQEGSDILFTAMPHPGNRVQYWKLNGEVLDGFTEDTYSVIFLDGDITVSVAFEEALNTGEIDPPSLAVFPNPARDQIFIEAGSQITSIRLIDIRGQTVKVLAADGTHAQISVASMAEGLYILQINTETDILNKRIQINPAF